MTLKQIIETLAVFEANYRDGASSKEVFKANVEGAMVLINTVHPNNKELISFIKSYYRDVVNNRVRP